MCTISDKLKLCTCKNISDHVKHYWILYRYVKGKEELIMGMPVMPANIAPGTDNINRKLLLNLLNTGNVFDEPLYPVHKDRLQISFEMNEGGCLNYGFVYKKNTWAPIAYDFFEWYFSHDEIKQGKIKNAFKKDAFKKL